MNGSPVASTIGAHCDLRDSTVQLLAQKAAIDAQLATKGIDSVSTNLLEHSAVHVDIGQRSAYHLERASSASSIASMADFLIGIGVSESSRRIAEGLANRLIEKGFDSERAFSLASLDDLRSYGFLDAHIKAVEQYRPKDRMHHGIKPFDAKQGGRSQPLHPPKPMID